MAEGKANDGRWAPWWAYVVPIIGLNLLKQYLVEDHVNEVADVAITVALVVVLVVVITAVYRSTHASRRR